MFLMELDPSEYTGPFNPEPIDLFECLSEEQKARGKRRSWSAMKEIKPCPYCGSTNIKKAHSLSKRLPWWWHIECWDCHWCGKQKLFLFRAIKSWNKEGVK